MRDGTWALLLFLCLVFFSDEVAILGILILKKKSFFLTFAVFILFLKAKLRIRSSKYKVSFPGGIYSLSKREMKRSDRYSVACNEDIVPDCCDEPRLPLRRNTPESPETRVSIIAGHKFWEETEIKQSRKQTAEVTLPYPNLFEELKDKNPDQFWMFSLNAAFG